MQLQLQDFTTLVRTMAAGVQGSARALIDLTTGSVLRAILEANAALALWLQWLIVQVLATTRAATSNGADLDSWVADLGMTRLPGQAAAASVTLSRITPGLAALVPVGAKVKTGDNAVSFTILPDASNAAFSAASASFVLAASARSITVPAQADVAGIAGNVQPGAISMLATALPGIDNVTNALAAAGGQEAEPDAALRGRFANFIDSRSRATPAAITFALQSLQQGLSYVLTENSDPSGATRLGFFTVTIDDGSGAPPGTLIGAAAAAIEGVRPVGTQFAVQAPQLMTANVALAIATPATTHVAAQSAVAAAIAAYVRSLPIGGALRTAKLAAVAFAADASITNVSGVSINGGADLVAGPRSVIRPGAVTVS